jgi:hypothetical protein
MVTISEFAQRHRLQLQRDAGDGTTIIPGRKGKSHLFEYDDESLGVMVMPDTGTAHWWNAARAAFLSAGMQITQDADGEGAATFDPENPEQVRLALKYADIKRRRMVSEAEHRRLARIGFRKPSAEIVTGLQSEFGRTVEGEKTA